MQSSPPPTYPVPEGMRSGVASGQPGPRGAATAAAGANDRRAGARTDSAAPTVWVLTDDKLGHSTQSVGLAEALGWPFEVKALHFNPLNRLSNRLLGTRLVSLDRRRSAPLEPPWPDLVISTGRRTVPATRWIGAQSGGRTRLVQLGRKGADRADVFDLSVTCKHFGLAPHPRRIETVAPFTSISDARLRAARERWRDLFAGLPRPHVALLVGGTSALHLLDVPAATRMAREVSRGAAAAGGAVYIVTSPRTDAGATAAMRAALGAHDRIYQWTASDPNNPYLGCLAVADVLVVTGDSESMLAEAAATTTPLYIYDLPERPGNVRQQLRAWVGARAAAPPAVSPPPSGGARQRVRARTAIATLCRALLATGIVRAPRDLTAMHRALIDAGYAQPFGAPLRHAARPPLRDLDHVVGRIRALMNQPAGGA